MDRSVVNVLKQMNEHDPYVRGMVAWVGYRQIAVDMIGKNEPPEKPIIH